VYWKSICSPLVLEEAIVKVESIDIDVDAHDHLRTKRAALLGGGRLEALRGMPQGGLQE
jgi:hypothetical protein